MEVLDNFLTWEFLATYAGATAATSVIVEFAKKVLDKYFNIPTQLVSYLVALVILLLAQVFTSGLTISNIILTLINAILVSLASNGAYDGIKRMVTKKDNT